MISCRQVVHSCFMQTGYAFDQVALHVARIKAGYRSVAAMARALGLSPGYCGLVVRGLVPPQETRAKIAAFLNVPEAQLWVLHQTPTPSKEASNMPP